MRARIIRSSQRNFDCRLSTGEVVVATAKGNLLKNDESLVVGDFVTLTLEQNYIITEREDRSSEIFRVLIREARRKVTAANCDVLFIVTSVSKPAFKRGIIDRFLVRAHQWGIPAHIIFNKMDEHDPETVDLNFEADRLSSLGVRCFELSALEPAYAPRFLADGPNELRSILKGKTAILLGQSGVGKSSTINFLSTKGEVNLKTQAVGRAGKGSHTTTWSEVIDMGEFDLIDSPGIRSLSLDDINPTELLSYFPDLEQIATTCKFSNCAHEPSSQGCGFNELGGSRREQELVMSRLESYHRILEEASSTPQWAKKV
jgi:ribosome biogenesis GTPase / thiamine phosphate phosphatase